MDIDKASDTLRSEIDIKPVAITPNDLEIWKNDEVSKKIMSVINCMYLRKVQDVIYTKEIEWHQGYCYAVAEILNLLSDKEIAINIGGQNE